MRSRSLAISTAGLLVVGVLFALAPSASAAAKIFVGTNPIGNGKNCTHPGYNSIQAAVTAAAAGKTIVVCPGTYAEQVVVSKNLKIQGSSSVSTFVQIPAVRANSACNPAVAGVNQQDIFDVCGAGVKVTISGLTIQGPWGPYPFNDCTVSPTGIAVMGGATLTTSNVIVTDIRQDSTGTGGINGCQGGTGIRIGRSATGEVGSATLTNTLVAAYQKAGVIVSNAGSTLTMSKSTIQGVGATEAIAQNGLQVADGAKATVTKSTMKGNECDHPSCGSDLMNNIQSFGVLLLDAGPGTSIASSTVRDNDAGLYNDETTGSNPKVTGTSFLANRYGGVTLDEGAITMMTDTISGSPTAVEVLSYNGQVAAPGPSVTQSTISGTTTGVVLEDDATVGYPQAALTLTRDDLSGSAYGVDNSDGSAVNAVKNFWGGGVNGPSDWSFGSGAGVSANVDFFPWFKQAAMTSQSSCNFMGNVNVVAAAFGIYCGNANNNIMVLNGNNGPTLMIGNGGNDTMTATGSAAHYFIGASGNDSFTSGGNGSDHAQGRGGSDTFSGVATTSP